MKVSGEEMAIKGRNQVALEAVSERRRGDA